MDKKQGVPIIGGKKTQAPGTQMQELIPAIVAQLTPTLDIILEKVTTLEMRMAVVEEVKQLFPAKIEVVVKHDHTKPTPCVMKTSAQAVDELVEEINKKEKK